MANVIKHKRGSGSDPAANNLVVGELAIRTDTGKLFTKMDSGAIAEIAGGGSDIAINTLSASSYSGGSGASSFNGSENRFTLSSPPNVSAAQLLVSVNGVIQKPVLGTGTPSEGFSVDGNDIIFSSPPETGADFFILTFRSLGVSEPANNSVTSAKIVDGAIVNADINASAAIAGTKISPDFGSQNIATTGDLTLSAGSILATDLIPANFKRNATGTNSVLVLLGNNTQTYALEASSSGFSINDYTNVNVARFSINSSGNCTAHNDLTVSGNLAVTTQSQFNNAVTINSGLFVGGTSVSGAEGGQIDLTQAPNSTLAGSSIVFDTVNNGLRFFESASPFKGAFLDISQQANSVASQIMTSTTGVTYTGTMTFGSGAGIDLSTNDVYLNARVIQNSTGGADDGLYIGYGNATGNGGHTRVYGAGSTTHHFTFDATNFFPGTDSHSSLGTSTNTWLNLFADTVNVTGPGSTTLKLTTAAGAVDVVSLDTSHASGTKPQMHFKLQGTPAFIIDQNQNISMGGNLVPGSNGAHGRFYDVYNLGTDSASFAVARFITLTRNSAATSVDGNIIKFRNGDFSLRNNETASEANINFYVSATEKARIDSAGRLLLGSTGNNVNGSSAKLQVSYVKNSEFGIHIRPSDNNTGGGGPMLFQNQAGTTIGSILANATNVSYNGQASDRTLKKNFEEWTENTLELFKKLKPQKFNFKFEDDEDAKSKGYIAQDLVDSFPEAYPKGPDDKYMFNASGMVVYLMKAVQELTAKVEALEAK